MMGETIEIAIEATVATMAAIFALLWFINQFSKKSRCVFCGDPSYDDFCSDECENNFYDESHLERDEDEALAEQEELRREERWERETKCR